jgi:hypothetical protein
VLTPVCARVGLSARRQTESGPSEPGAVVVAVIVVVIVAAPVAVAVHLNGNATVDVLSGLDELGQHRDRVLEQLDSSRVLLLIKAPADFQDIEVGR